MAIVIDDHGGGCCGIRNLSYFNGRIGEVQDLEGYIKRHLDSLPANADEDDRGDEDSCYLSEIVLTDWQMKEYPELLTKMKTLGFKRVSRFKNKNTNNVCNVFHCYTETIEKAVEY